MKQLMTTKEAAEYLGLSAQSLNEDRSTRRGSLGVPFAKVGRLVRYRRSDLDRWVAEHMEVPAR